MEKIILFSEVVSEKACKAAKRFAEQGDIVYALAGKGEEQKAEGIHYLETDRCNEEEIKRVIGQIHDGHLDLLVLSVNRHCAEDGSIMQPHNYGDLLDTLNENVVCTLIVVNAALPLLKAGKGKRIAVLTEDKSSISRHRGEDDYGYQMSLASVNMMEHILFNALRPEGFTFRNYAVSEISGGMEAVDYFERNLSYDASDAYIHSDENRLVMRDALLCEIPW